MAGVNGFGKSGSYDLTKASQDNSRIDGDNPKKAEGTKNKTGKKNGRRISRFPLFRRKSIKSSEKTDTFRSLTERTVQSVEPTRQINTAAETAPTPNKTNKQGLADALPGVIGGGAGVVNTAGSAVADGSNSTPPEVVEAIEGFGEVAALAGDAGDISALTDDSGSITATAGGGTLTATTGAGSLRAARDAGNIAHSTDSGEITSSASAGEITSSASAGEITSSASAGEITSSASAGEITSSASAGEITSSASAGEITSSASAGEITSSASAGEITSSASAGEITSSASAGEITSSASAGEITSSASAGEITSSASAGEITSSASAGEITSSASAGEITSSASAGEITSSASAGEITSSASAGEITSSASAGEITNSDSTAEIANSVNTEEITASADTDDISTSTDASDFTSLTDAEDTTILADAGSVATSTDAGDLSAPVEASKLSASADAADTTTTDTFAFSEGVESELSEIHQDALNQLTPEDLQGFQQEGVAIDDIESVFSEAEDKFQDQLGTHDLDQFSTQDFEALQAEYNTFHDGALAELGFNDGASLSESGLIDSGEVSPELAEVDASSVQNSSAAQSSAIGPEPSEASEYFDQLLDPVSVGVDVGVGILSHSVTLGFKLHKLSKLQQRKEAFEASGQVVKHWGANSTATGKVSVQDMKDYALMSKLAGNKGNEDSDDPLRSVLGENKCHYGSDEQILNLTNQLIILTGNKQGSSSNEVSERLTEWKKAFEIRSDEFKNKLVTADTDKNDVPLKSAHQSKKMMAQFNDILKPVGIKVDYSTPLKKGKSALASKHKLVINENRMHAYLEKSGQLPERSTVKEYITNYSGDTDTLEAFSNYEDRKIKHQKSQTKWTVGAMVTSAIPVLKADYLVRSGREMSEHNYRKKNNTILDAKLNALANSMTRHSAVIGKNAALRNALGTAVEVINAKKDRTEIKSDTAAANSAIDAVDGVAGTVAATAAPGVGSLVADSLVGAARLGVTVGSALKRRGTDKKNQQFGRIETKVYSELKQIHNNAQKGEEGDAERKAVKDITGQLFDVSEKQVALLFNQSDSQDLVSQKGIIRLRFNNFDATKPAK